MGGGRLCIGVHKATREAAGAEIGDPITLEVARDDAPRVLELPPELEAAFAAEPRLRERFDELAFTRRRELAGPDRRGEAAGHAGRAAREGAQRPAGAAWQRGHQYVSRASSPWRRTATSVPQRRHGRPARP